ncbi:MAG TPA: sigma 54-interacting transcriptional regulator [Kofleriaceae bacterium]|nr:sigma 54-interacting transcriptional regulator [Kofleriaceae bacterium]
MTYPLDGTTIKEQGNPVLQMRTALILYHRDGAMIVQISKGKTVVVGRAPPSDVVIAELGLSRQHARFTWGDDGIWVEDLGSTNGTKKNGEPITRATLAYGDELAVGPVIVALHAVAPTDDELRGFDGHDRFVAALAEEVTRARTFQRPLTLMMVRAANAKEGHVSRWAPRLRARLRPVDRVGIYGPSAVLVSLPETTPDAVHGLVGELTSGTPPLTCRAVGFPGDGGSVEELIAALQVATSASRPVSSSSDSAGVVVKSAAMKQVMSAVKRVAASTIAVLIQGETGTGKEVLARAIHEAGPRKKKPLRCINCAAIPGMLIESVLFGHEQGAFTSADKSARGLFEQADGGTVLLDEIGELAAPAQAALLRVLETKKVTRVGGDREIDVDVRVIAATHRDLETMVESGRFRADLLYRLNPMTLHIPPLRERVEEIRPLAERFLKEANKQAGTQVRAFEPQALEALERYPWPGNVRELRNVIDRAVVLAEGPAITLAELTERVRGTSAVAPPVSEGELPAGDYKDHVRRYEVDLILKTLRAHGGNQTEAAKALQMPLRTLVHKIQTYGIRKTFDR